MAPYPLRLYRFRFSTNVERVALALAHKEVEVQSVWVDAADRGEVLRVSGQELVPVLVDGDRVVADSTAILEYLEERFPQRPLYPDDGPRRTELRLFVDWFNRVWKRPPNLIVDEEAKAEPDPALIAELEAEIADALPLFEELLSGRDFLFGHELSAADVVAFPFLKYALLWEEGDPDRFHEVLRDTLQLGAGFPRLENWIRRIDALPRA
ncbi:MAG TPA: glutathione S-transferase family protein [Gaiellaceae bacterium]|nr:glutathione S-transferase family protein [Gaiellaceae bacterium]